jgi:molecular chaperone GrpE
MENREENQPTDTEQNLDENQESNTENQEASNEAEQGIESNSTDELAEMKDKYVRLYAEFDNFRRRTAKEKIDIIKTAGQEIMTALLPVLDDFGRASKAIDEATEVASVKDGVNLIHTKINNILTAKGLKPMDTIGKDFDAETMEAITQIPAPTEEMKGKVIDEIEKGYYLDEKVIRYAKVVVGA